MHIVFRYFCNFSFYFCCCCFTTTKELTTSSFLLYGLFICKIHVHLVQYYVYRISVFELWKSFCPSFVLMSVSFFGPLSPNIRAHCNLAHITIFVYVVVVVVIVVVDSRAVSSISLFWSGLYYNLRFYYEYYSDFQRAYSHYIQIGRR